jgi:hypothetical protein
MTLTWKSSVHDTRRCSRWLLGVTGLALLLASHARATIDTVYVDNRKVCPCGPGTTLSNAYKSIVTAIDSTHGPDKVIAVVGSGVIYREAGTINVPGAPGDSGTIGHPYVLMARGSVTIDAADVTTSWTTVDPNKPTLWRTTVTGANDVPQVFLEGLPFPYVERKDITPPPRLTCRRVSACSRRRAR